jgi:hypothetical protein
LAVGPNEPIERDLRSVQEKSPAQKCAMLDRQSWRAGIFGQHFGLSTQERQSEPPTEFAGGSIRLVRS